VVRFSYRMVPEVYQVFWAGMAADESPAKSSVSAVGPPMQVQLSSHKVDRHHIQSSGKIRSGRNPPQSRAC
jgi:hypothetical protein